jgi:hypothetical protein
MLIKQNVGVSGDAKQAAGIPQINTTREPISAPTTVPVLSVTGAMEGAQTIKYVDSLVPSARGRKPDGVQRLDLFCVVADEPAEQFSNAAHYVGAYTRNPIAVSFEPEDDGKVATYFGRWATAKGDAGPISAGVSFRIAA